MITIMIPTRKRPSRLLRTIHTLYETATDDKFNVIIRADDDDEITPRIAHPLLKYPRLEMKYGPRLGYHMLDAGYYAGMEEAAQTHWVWIAGDDMLVEGDWMGEMKKVPLHGYIVQPEFSRLGHSIYERAEGQAFPIFPKHCWKPYSEKFPVPFDTAGSDLLLAHGWETWFLEGVTMWHDRPPEAEIANHRMMDE